MKLNIIYKYHSLLLINLVMIALDVLNEQLSKLSLDDLIVLHLILITKPLRDLISLQVLLDLHKICLIVAESDGQYEQVVFQLLILSIVIIIFFMLFSHFIFLLDETVGVLIVRCRCHFYRLGNWAIIIFILFTMIVQTVIIVDPVHYLDHVRVNIHVLLLQLL